MRKLLVAVAGVLLALSVTGPAVAKDTSWGCGGACRAGHHAGH